MFYYLFKELIIFSFPPIFFSINSCPRRFFFITSSTRSSLSQATMASLITLLIFSITTSLLYTATAAVTYDVVSFGAKADGITDSSKAFVSAWASACGSTKAATIHVPSGKFFVKTATFAGPCKNTAITFKIDGTLVASSDYNVIGNSGNWIVFQHVNGVNVYGGVLDGQGTGLWSCKNSGKSCPSGATVSIYTFTIHM